MSYLRAMFTCLSLFDDGSLLAKLQVKSTWIDQVWDKQLGDDYLVLWFRQVEDDSTSDLRLNSDGVLQCILREAHSSLYAMHPSGNKMYRDLRELYWWSSLKWEVTDFVSHCLMYQQVKAEHQLALGLLQPVKIPMWKWKRVTMDFIDGQFESVIQMLKNMLQSCVIDFRGSWEDFLPLAEVLGLELVSKTEDKVRLIRDYLKVSSDMKKSYVNLKRRDIEYSVGYYVFLKLELPPELDRIHDMFHVSILRRYQSDSSHVVYVEEIEDRPELTFEEELVQILDRDIKVSMRKSIPLVKVLWRNHSTEEAMWEPKDSICL
ncbi:uncharacterized protein LOC108462505 [Gossypium arboreum]|uniref:uncharacterized protein LOC108462505 n=1 Tax=Gossypium arboreum TaxID=29729 RepID=UPI0008197670|nr:uncharacterized protein LOC108462505 [Gossypium arboreum]